MPTKSQNRKTSLVFHVKICQADVFILKFLKFLFPICSFCRFWLFNIVVYQLLTNNQQVFKKKIMMVVGACIFLVAAAQAMPLFFGI
jgi:hypothetical protein